MPPTFLFLAQAEEFELASSVPGQNNIGNKCLINVKTNSPNKINIDEQIQTAYVMYQRPPVNNTLP